MRILEGLLLNIPYLFLKKIPYAWVAVVMFWAWPPVVSGLFLGIILLGLLLMYFQGRAWESKIGREMRVLHRDQPRLPLSLRVRNVALTCAVSAVLAILLDQRLGLSAIQWFLLMAGVMLLYRDALLLGAAAIYLITDKGIAVRFIPGHVDYRPFFRFDEMRELSRVTEVDRVPPDWSLLTPARKATSGLLLIPKNSNGFSREFQQVLLAPADLDVFLEHIPARWSSSITSFIRH